jgi:hypothetical protein
LPKNGGDAVNRRQTKISSKKPDAISPLCEIQTAPSKIEFNVLNPYLIVLSGPRPMFGRDERRTPKARGELDTNLAFVNEQCVNDN